MPLRLLHPSPCVRVGSTLYNGSNARTKQPNLEAAKLRWMRSKLSAHQQSKEYCKLSPARSGTVPQPLKGLCAFWVYGMASSDTFIAGLLN